MLRRRSQTSRRPARRATTGALRLGLPARRDATLAAHRGGRMRRLALVALLLAVLGGAGYGGWWLLLSDTLRVRDVTVVGAQITDPRAVAYAAALGGQSLLTLDAGAAARRVASLPGVREATVHRDWRRGVIVDITEEQGWGYWQASGMRRVIDIDGRVLERARPPAGDAPTIIEVGPPPASEADLRPDPDTVRLVARLVGDGALAAMGVEPEGFVFRRDRGLTVLVAGGPHAVLGDSHNYEFKVSTWGALLERLEADGGLDAVREIDLRFGRRVVMR